MTPVRKRKAVVHLREAFGMSERRARKAIGRMTMRYQTTRMRPSPAHAGDRPRALHVLLKREGYLINQKKLFPLYREEKLAVRRRAVASGRSDQGADAGSDDAERPLVARLSCRVTLPTAAAFASWPSSMIVAASVWRWSRTPRSPASAWRGN